MPRTVSASEAKTQFGAILDWAIKCKDDVIVESHGKPKAVIISFEEHQKVAELREQGAAGTPDSTAEAERGDAGGNRRHARG